MNVGIPDAFVEALLLVAVIGAAFGLIGGFLGSKHRLLGSILMGVIGGISVAAIARIAGADPGITVGEDFSALYAAAGGLVLGFAVNRSTA
ncbi:MAG: hypothetical protein ACT4OP_05750 [Actinomycetota bacterium]